MGKLRTTPRKDFVRHMSTTVPVNTCGIQILSFGVSEFSEYIASISNFHNVATFGCAVHLFHDKVLPYIVDQVHQ